MDKHSIATSLDLTGVPDANGCGPHSHTGLRHTLLLVWGPLAVSTAPMLIVLCAMDSAAMASWRLFGAAAVLFPLAATRIRREIAALSAREFLALVGAGVGYGLHFILFILAFTLTSYESAVILLASQPVLAAILGRLILNERTTVRMWLAVAVAATGLVLLMLNDLTLDRELLDGTHLLGDLVVLLACLAVVLSYTLGRRLRRKLSFGSYTASIYFIGGVVALTWALVCGDRFTGYQIEQWSWLPLLILVPTIVGHSTFNYLVKHVRVFYINLVILLEPLLALIGKWLIDQPERFGEATMGGWQIAGGLVLMAGVVYGLVVRERGRAEPPPI